MWVSVRRRVGFIGSDICGRGLELLGSRCFFFVGRRGERAWWKTYMYV